MNDMASSSEYLAARAGHLDVDARNALLRRTPDNLDGHLRPIDAAAPLPRLAHLNALQTSLARQ